jgi:hypothetical protein
MKISRPVFITACLLIAGCFNPAMFKKGAYSMDDWESWLGWNDSRGRHEVRDGRLYYYPQADQDSSIENPSGGANPGLIAAKELQGQNWWLEFKAVPHIKPGAKKSFLTYVWFGDETRRPLPESAGTAFKILFEQLFEAGSDRARLLISYGPGGKIFELPRDAGVLRIERAGKDFKALYSRDGKTFGNIFEAEAPQTLGALSQKIAIGAKAAGEPGGAFCEYEYIKFNSQDLIN